MLIKFRSEKEKEGIKKNGAQLEFFSFFGGGKLLLVEGDNILHVAMA